MITFASTIGADISKAFQHFSCAPYCSQIFEGNRHLEYDVLVTRFLLEAWKKGADFAVGRRAAAERGHVVFLVKRSKFAVSSIILRRYVRERSAREIVDARHPLRPELINP